MGRRRFLARCRVRRRRTRRASVSYAAPLSHARDNGWMSDNLSPTQSRCVLRNGKEGGVNERSRRFAHVGALTHRNPRQRCWDQARGLLSDSPLVHNPPPSFSRCHHRRLHRWRVVRCRKSDYYLSFIADFGWRREECPLLLCVVHRRRAERIVCFYVTPFSVLFIFFSFFLFFLFFFCSGSL